MLFGRDAVSANSKQKIDLIPPQEVSITKAGWVTFHPAEPDISIYDTAQVQGGYIGVMLGQLVHVPRRKPLGTCWLGNQHGP